MLELYDFLYLTLRFFFLNIYIYYLKVVKLILFYPLSIFFAILVLLWFFFILTITANKFTSLTKHIIYITRLFYVLNLNTTHLSILTYNIFGVLNNIFFFVSEYFFIFQLKRIEFYFFLFFLMCLFL